MGEFPSITWDPSPHGKGSYAKRYLVFHNTSNNATPTAECNWNRNRQDGIGFHFVGDPNDFRQGLYSYTRIGHVGSTTGNNYGISFEMCGYNSSPAEYWKHILDRAAAGLKLVIAKHGIPARFLTEAQMRDGSSKGFITHDMARRVWGGSDHTDPGPNFPRDYAVAILGGTTPPVVHPSPGPSKIAEDRRLGPQTIRRWQQYMGTPVDGFISPDRSSLVVAVQQYLNRKHNAGLVVDGRGIAQDGKTYKTVRALQRHLGTTADGKLSVPNSDAVLALQRALNNNTF
jgi:hypothetical protein